MESGECENLCRTAAGDSFLRGIDAASGGRIVYSTCTFAPEENEGTIARFYSQIRSFILFRWSGLPGCLPEYRHGLALMWHRTYRHGDACTYDPSFPT